MWGGNSFLRLPFFLIIIFFLTDVQCQRGVVDFSVQALLGRDINTVPAERVLSRCEFYPHLKKNLPELLKARLYDASVVIDGKTIDSRAEESFSRACFNCLKPDLIPDSAKSDVSAFMVEFLKNELLERLYAHVQILRVTSLHYNVNVSNGGLPLAHSVTKKKLALLGERNDAFAELIGAIEASLLVLKISSINADADTEKKTKAEFMNLFRVCNFFYKVHVMVMKNGASSADVSQMPVDKKILVQKMIDYSFDSKFILATKDTLRPLIQARLKNIAGVILGNFGAKRDKQPFFVKMCEEIVWDSCGSAIDQLELLEYSFGLLLDALVFRLHTFARGVASVGEMLRKQNEIDYKTQHSWPCGCYKEGCKAGCQDFDEYRALLDIINSLLIDMIKIFDGASCLLVDREFCVYSENEEKYFLLCESIQDCTRERLARFGVGIGAYQMWG